MSVSTLILNSIFLLLVNALHGQSKLPAGFKLYKTKIFANESDWIATGVHVRKGDFVVFEAFGKVVLGSVLVQGEVSATGDLNPYALVFNRYAATRHGALLCMNDDRIIEAKGSETMWKLLDPFERKYWDAMEEDFVGFYFVSKADQELKFVVNDKHYSNNKGFFDVTITVLPLKVHRERNKFNKCPLREPVCYEDITAWPNSGKKYPGDDIYRCRDVKNYKWIRADHEWYFHGGAINSFNYKTYRGDSPQLSGCQCTYDKEGMLVNDEDMGTFDYAFNLESLENPVKYHTLWDVFPHNAFKEYFNEEDKAFEYDVTQTRY